DYKNYGDESTLEVQPGLGSGRVLIKFDKAQITDLLTDNELISARLEFPIYKNKLKRSETISLHRLLVDWSEDAATWDCPIDNNLNNHKKDCNQTWNLYKSWWHN